MCLSRLAPSPGLIYRSTVPNTGKSIPRVDQPTPCPPHINIDGCPKTDSRDKQTNCGRYRNALLTEFSDRKRMMRKETHGKINRKLSIKTFFKTDHSFKIKTCWPRRFVYLICVLVLIWEQWSIIQCFYLGLELAPFLQYKDSDGPLLRWHYEENVRYMIENGKVVREEKYWCSNNLNQSLLSAK